MSRKRKVLVYVAAAFAIFYMFTRPAQAASAVNGVFDGIVNGADKLAVFATALLK